LFRYFSYGHLVQILNDTAQNLHLLKQFFKINYYF